MMARFKVFNLVLSSALMLFTEMLILRWSSESIYSLKFFTNYILIGCFLGIGLGFLLIKKQKNYFRFSPILLSVLILSCYLYCYYLQPFVQDFFALIVLDRQVSSMLFFTDLLFIAVVFILVVLTMALIADKVADEFSKLTSLNAYRYEVMGTILGIIIFSILAYYETPPLVWGFLLTTCFAVLLLPTWKRPFSWLMIAQVCSLTLILIVLSMETYQNHNFWSAYNKIHIEKIADSRVVARVGASLGSVNDDESEDVKVAHFKPFQYFGSHKRNYSVLVIGSGSGSDVKNALVSGSSHVDAVELDSRLLLNDKKIKNDSPYHDSRVNIYVDDGRAFLESSKNKYDVILYSVSDPTAKLPEGASVRLENFHLTLDGLRVASKHLKSDGVFSIYIYSGSQWLIAKLATSLETIYRKPVCIDSVGSDSSSLTILSAAHNKDLSCRSIWQAEKEQYEPPATDNYPFVFLKSGTFPKVYLVSLIFIVVIAVSFLNFAGASVKAIYHYFDMFLMGCAFLLLETKSVVSYSLLFGSTWLVNSLVFMGILASVFAAIEVVERFKIWDQFILYLLLGIALFVLWFVPTHSLLVFPPTLRFLFSTVITFSPIFIANLIFANRLKAVSSSTDAMGANLFGAVLGGVAEYSSMLIGYHNFPFIILFIYSLAFYWLLSSGEDRSVVRGGVV